MISCSAGARSLLYAHQLLADTNLSISVRLSISAEPLTAVVKQEECAAEEGKDRGLSPPSSLLVFAQSGINLFIFFPTITSMYYFISFNHSKSSKINIEDTTIIIILKFFFVILKKINYELVN